MAKEFQIKEPVIDVPWTKAVDSEEAEATLKLRWRCIADAILCAISDMRPAHRVSDDVIAERLAGKLEEHCV